MTTISFQCYACNQVLKVGADKAGKRGKCPKCGTALTIPVASPDGGAAPPPMMPGPHTTPMPQQFAPPYEQQQQYPQQQYPQQQYPPQQPYQQPAYDPMQQGYQPPQPVGPIRAEIVEDPPVYGAPVYGAPVYEGGYDDGGVARPGSPWGMTRLGLLLVFISGCVLAGAFLFQFIGYLIFTINLIGELTGTAGPGRGDFMGMSSIVEVMFKLAEIVTVLGAITALVGYVMCILGPNQRGTMPLAITAVSVAAVGLILAFIFRMLPIMGSRPMGTGHPFFPWFMLLLCNLLFGAELILFTLFLKAVTRAHPRGRRMPSVTAVLTLAIIYTAVRALGWIFLYVAISMRMSPNPSFGGIRAMMWIFLLLLWAGITLYILFSINYLMRLWAIRSLVK